MKSKFKLFLYYLIQFTWGLPQNVIGFCVALRQRGAKRERYNGAFITYHNGDWGGISLGCFIIMNGAKDAKWTRNIKIHEYGHTVQSLIFGPFYLLVVGIPSFIWCNAKRFVKLREEKGVSYFSVFPENHANRLGEAVTKEKFD